MSEYFKCDESFQNWQPVTIESIIEKIHEEFAGLRKEVVDLKTQIDGIREDVYRSIRGENA